MVFVIGLVTRLNGSRNVMHAIECTLMKGDAAKLSDDQCWTRVRGTREQRVEVAGFGNAAEVVGRWLRNMKCGLIDRAKARDWRARSGKKKFDVFLHAPVCVASVNYFSLPSALVFFHFAESFFWVPAFPQIVARLQRPTCHSTPHRSL
jgi:hypothetical protein